MHTAHTIVIVCFVGGRGGFQGNSSSIKLPFFLPTSTPPFLPPSAPLFIVSCGDPDVKGGRQVVLVVVVGESGGGVSWTGEQDGQREKEGDRNSHPLLVIDLIVPDLLDKPSHT